MQDYQGSMDPYMEELGSVLSDLGYTKDGLSDPQLVEAASRKLKTLYNMLLSTGMNEQLLKAVMAE